jgi:hypothetical protein
MGNKGYGSIPGALSECITFLAMALLVRSAPSLIELLIGAILTQTGFVTSSWLAISGPGLPWEDRWSGGW